MDEKELRDYIDSVETRCLVRCDKIDLKLHNLTESMCRLKEVQIKCPVLDDLSKFKRLVIKEIGLMKGSNSWNKWILRVIIGIIMVIIGWEAKKYVQVQPKDVKEVVEARMDKLEELIKSERGQ